MQVLPRLVLGFVAVTILVNDILACSDIKTFLAPCDVKESGTSISKEQALDVPSKFVNVGALKAIADKAVEYFDFDLAVFNGKCEVPVSEACNIINCGCEEVDTSEGPAPRLNTALDECFPWPNRPGCDNGAPYCFQGPCSSEPTGETIMALCFGNECKGFSFLSEAVNQNRRRRCGESIDFCTDGAQEPLCDAEIVTKCCDTPSLVCVCETCSLRVWRQIEIGSGRPAFIHRQSGNRCTCTNN